MTALVLPEHVRDDLPVRGHGKIELFSERGKLVERIPFENAIHALMTAHAKWRVRTAFSDYPPLTPNSTTWQVSNGLGTNNNDQQPLYAMRDLICFADTSAVDPTDEIIRGAVVAWCGKDFYVGTDIRRGGLNQLETIFRTDYVRWVADWPTNSGNGTFRSVGWGYTQEPSPVTTTTDPYNRPMQPAKLLTSGLVAQPLGVTDAQRQGTNHQPAYSPANELWSATSGAWVWKNAGEPSYQWQAPDNAYNLSWTPSGQLWATGFDGSTPSGGTNRVYRLNPATGAIITTCTMPRWPPGFISTSGISGQRLFTMVDDATMYVMYGNDNRIYKLTLAGTVWSVDSVMPVSDVGFGISGFYAGMSRYSDGDLMLQQDGTVIKYNPVTGVTKWMAYGSRTAYNNGYGTAAKQDGTEGWTTVGGTSGISNYTMYFESFRPYGLGTRVLLPAPVTKTNLQTMKITYQFDFA